ncbi:DUF1963 domain-containing protein [Amphritea atlantica]|uniref:DUF1963 domain-containing protein n=1 Tax=Amphritea atlantica TaxID=355243 RepID=A0ABY5H047_9GAMM|nr:DUF1963 domain-containing protein [Amphritea atlantica]
MEIKKILKFVKFEPGDSPKTKFGGQPDWLETPQWPISPELEGPMRFIAQIALGDVFPECKGKIAYLFMTEDDDQYIDGTWEPDGGENAVIIQPSGGYSLTTEALESGPSREVFGVEVVATEIGEGELEGSRLGGTPEFMQSEEYPGPKEEWRFLAQLDSCSLPFEINFGDAGIAYVFLNRSATEGKFLWQCG